MRNYLAAALLLIVYLFPWVVNPSASLTANAYDLAAWASVHPAVQAETPTLLTCLLLRLPLACIALLVAFGARRSALSALVVLVAVAALLPPLEFIHDTGNPNYRQQAALALLTLLAGGIGVSGILPRYRGWIAVGIALVGAASSALGLLRGYELMRGFGLETQIGVGGVGLALAFAVIAVMLAAGERRAPGTQAFAINQTG
ncbi:MAG: hypothetical protein U0521_07145 [Anaerolineae bacterium]